MKRIFSYPVWLWFGLATYTLSSYLIVLRDPFLLERLALSLNLPWIESTGLEWASRLKVNYTSIGLLVIAVCLSFWAFWHIWKQKIVVSKTFIAGLIITVFLSFPALSTDIFDYNNINRVAYIHQQNPWIYPANQFPKDGEIYLGSWIDRTTVYPPVSFGLNSLVYWVFGAKLFNVIVGFKLLSTIFFVLIGYVSYRFLTQKNSFSYLTWLLNPLLLIEFVGNGHNDLILGLFTLLAVIWWTKKQFVVSALFVAVAVLSKVTMLIYLPLLLLHQFGKVSLKSLSRWLLIVVGVSSLGLVLMGQSSIYLLTNIYEQMSIYQKSLPTVLRILVMEFTSESMANLIQKLIVLPIFLALAIRVWLKKLPVYDALVSVMIWYLCVYAPMLQPWYLAWFLVFIPAVRSSRIKVASFVFALGGMLSYPLYYLSLFYHPLSPWWQLWLALCMIIGPVVTLLLPDKWYTQLSSKL